LTLELAGAPILQGRRQDRSGQEGNGGEMESRLYVEREREAIGDICSVILPFYATESRIYGQCHHKVSMRDTQKAPD